MSKTLYILYNADASLMGKVKYSYKKICRTDGNPECAACQITHGGLSLNETPDWQKAKQQIETEESMKVVQWHRDELSDQVCSILLAASAMNIRNDCSHLLSYSWLFR